MPKGDSLKKYKIEQKAQTRKRLLAVIEELKDAGETKITVTKIAALAGITRASIYANYKDIINSLDLGTVQTSTQDFKDQDDIIAKLKEENKRLNMINSNLMDQLIAVKTMLKNKMCQ